MSDWMSMARDLMTDRYLLLVDFMSQAVSKSRGWKNLAALILGVSPSHLSKILSGERAVGLDVAQRAATNIGIPLSFFSSAKLLKDVENDVHEAANRRMIHHDLEGRDPNSTVISRSARTVGAVENLSGRISDAVESVGNATRPQFDRANERYLFPTEEEIADVVHEARLSVISDPVAALIVRLAHVGDGDTGRVIFLIEELRKLMTEK